MCWCRPEVRTPNCGRVECHPPLAKVSQKQTMEIPPILFGVEIINQETGAEYQEHYNTNSLEAMKRSLQNAIDWIEALKKAPDAK